MANAYLGNTYALANLGADLGSGTPATWYMALLTAFPTDGDGTGLVECSATGYSRQAITNNTTNFPAPSVVAHIASCILQLAVTFGPVSGLSGPLTVVGVTLYSAASGGNLGRSAVFGDPSAPVTYVLNNAGSLTLATATVTFQQK